MQPPVVTSFVPARSLPQPVQHPYLGPLTRYFELRGANLRPTFWFEPGGEDAKRTSYVIVRGMIYPFVRREADGSSVLVGIPAASPWSEKLVVTDQQPLSLNWYDPDTGMTSVYVVGSSQLCGASQCVLAPAVGRLPTRRPGAQLRQRSQRSASKLHPWDCAEVCWKASDVLHPGDFGAYEECLDACKKKWGSFSTRPVFGEPRPGAQLRQRQRAPAPAVAAAYRVG